MSAAQKRPAPGSLTGRVWEIAEALTKRRGRLAERAEVIREFVAEGGNENTASTQFHYWKKSRAQTAVERPNDAAHYVTLPLKEGGRILLPADLRELLGVAEGDRLQGIVIDGELRLMSHDTALKRARQLVRARVPAGVSLVDELLAERRAEQKQD
jgi:bifunctional DNA-binding transcriptional regulator/antitoxin component of YhaV-PrlF toxin-antitoxin module